jgi:glycosyltransferase involved in cell wall biosynthesis
VSSGNKRVRVLYSFPHRLGADRICYTAWQQVNGLAAAGAEVIVCAGSLEKPVASGVEVRPTLARGKVRLPYKLVGSERAFALHDYIVSRRIKKLAGRIDIVHAWPSGSLRTLEAAAKLGIPSVLERPNAHTGFALERVQRECELLGIKMPEGHEHGGNPEKTRLEDQEFRLADRLLCPSDFVARTFVEHGFPREKLARHQYGFDEKTFFPDGKPRDPKRGLTLLFVGGCAPRKGLHYALEAWLASTAHHNGRFLIAGGFIPGYAERLSSMLSDPSVHMLGHRRDVPELMRGADVLILPSIEEGSALVTYEARGSGCVLLVSDAAGAVCQHGENALCHDVGDVASLTRHITMLHDDRALLETLRENSLRTAKDITWTAAGRVLLGAYQDAIAGVSRETVERTMQESAR